MDRKNTYPEIVDWLEKGFTLDLDDYVALIQEGRSWGWPLKLGLEMDYIPVKRRK